FQCLVVAGGPKAAKDQRTAGRDLDRRQARAKLCRGRAEQRTAFWHINGSTFRIVTPVVKTAEDRAIAGIGVAQWEGAMNAAVLERAQFLTKALDEHRTCRD